MFQKHQCAHWWQHSDYLQFNQLLDLWCENDPVCREAKYAALVTQMERRVIKYRRTDGKTFDDPVMYLAPHNAIAVERESFQAWLDSVGEPDPLPVKIDPALSQKNLLLTVALLAEKIRKDCRRNDSAIKEDIEQEGYHGLGKSNLDTMFAAANKALANVERKPKR